MLKRDASDVSRHSSTKQNQMLQIPTIVVEPEDADMIPPIFVDPPPVDTLNVSSTSFQSQRSGPSKISWRSNYTASSSTASSFEGEISVEECQTVLDALSKSSWLS